jgi:hypothetical protein
MYSCCLLNYTVASALGCLGCLGNPGTGTRDRGKSGTIFPILVGNTVLPPCIFNRGVVCLATWKVKRNHVGTANLPEKKNGNIVPVF